MVLVDVIYVFNIVILMQMGMNMQGLMISHGLIAECQHCLKKLLRTFYKNYVNLEIVFFLGITIDRNHYILNLQINLILY